MAYLEVAATKGVFAHGGGSALHDRSGGRAGARSSRVGRADARERVRPVKRQRRAGARPPVRNPPLFSALLRQTIATGEIYTQKWNMCATTQSARLVAMRMAAVSRTMNILDGTKGYDDGTQEIPGMFSTTEASCLLTRQAGSRACGLLLTGYTTGGPLQPTEAGGARERVPPCGTERTRGSASSR